MITSEQEADVYDNKSKKRLEQNRREKKEEGRKKQKGRREQRMVIVFI